MPLYDNNDRILNKAQRVWFDFVGIVKWQGFKPGSFVNRFKLSTKHSPINWISWKILANDHIIWSTSRLLYFCNKWHLNIQVKPPSLLDLAWCLLVFAFNSTYSTTTPYHTTHHNNATRALLIVRRIETSLWDSTSVRMVHLCGSPSLLDPPVPTSNYQAMFKSWLRTSSRYLLLFTVYTYSGST